MVGLGVAVGNPWGVRVIVGVEVLVVKGVRTIISDGVVVAAGISAEQATSVTNTRSTGKIQKNRFMLRIIL